MLQSDPTEKFSKASFDKWLGRAIHVGEVPPTDCGLDDDTNDALYDIAAAFPRASETLIKRAKTCFNAMEA